MDTLGSSSAFDRLSPDDVLTDGSVPEYETGISAIFGQLVELNADLFIVDRILAFPFGLLTVPDERIFYRRVTDNLLLASILTITRLCTDQGEDLFTIGKFRNRLLELVRPEYKVQFQKSLRASKFEHENREVLAKMTTMRNLRIAHSKLSALTELNEHDVVELDEIKKCRDIIAGQLRALAFNTLHLVLPPAYDPDFPGFNPDIDQVLDGLAARSPLVSMPEASPNEWQMQRSYLSQAQLDALNRVRDRLHLGPV